MDVQEILLQGGECDQREAVKAALRGFFVYARPKCFSIEWRKRPIAIFGVSPHPISPRTCYIGLLGTKDIDAVWRRLVRTARPVIAMLMRLGAFDEAQCVISETNTVHRRWVEWVGFEPVERIYCGNATMIRYRYLLPVLTRASYAH